VRFFWTLCWPHVLLKRLCVAKQDILFPQTILFSIRQNKLRISSSYELKIWVIWETRHKMVATRILCLVCLNNSNLEFITWWYLGFVSSQNRIYFVKFFKNTQSALISANTKVSKHWHYFLLYREYITQTQTAGRYCTRRHRFYVRAARR